MNGSKALTHNSHVFYHLHYDDVIMGTIASQITCLTSVYSTVYSGADQSKHQSSASLAFVWGIHRGPVNSSHKWPVTRKMFPFDDVIMWLLHVRYSLQSINMLYLNTGGKQHLIFVLNRCYKLSLRFCPSHHTGIVISHHSDVTWVPLRMISRATWLFVRRPVLAKTKETFKITYAGDE